MTISPPNSTLPRTNGDEEVAYSETSKILEDRLQCIMSLLEQYREDGWSDGDRARTLALVKSTLAWRKEHHTSEAYCATIVEIDAFMFDVAQKMSQRQQA